MTRINSFNDSPAISYFATTVAMLAFTAAACGSGGAESADPSTTTTSTNDRTSTTIHEGSSTTNLDDPIIVHLDEDASTSTSTTLGSATSETTPASGRTSTTVRPSSPATSAAPVTTRPPAPATTTSVAPTTTKPPSPTTTEAPPSAEAKKAEFRAEFFRLLKEERAKNGLAAPAIDSRVEAVSNKLCNKLMNENWGHYTAEQRRDLLAQQGYNTDLTTGETLRADGSNQNVANTDMKTYAKFLLNDWMGSPSHRAVLMSTKNTNFGFCVIWGMPQNGDPGMEGAYWIMGGLINARPPA